jgi:ribosomal protein S18 acetylase RimI-like enzyme
MMDARDVMTQADGPTAGQDVPAGLSLVEVGPAHPDWPLVERFLHDHTDPVDDLLLWADVASGLGRLSRVWLATDGRAACGLAFAFPLWPSLPAIGLKGNSSAIERAMLEALAALGAMTRGFVIAESDQLPLFEATGTLSDRLVDLHMTLDAKAWRPADTRDVRPARLDELDAFYRAQGAPAWNPVQFETGPYVVISDGDRVVAAAGTQFAYPGLAQIGNVFTDPAHRGRGYAERATASVVDALVARGYPTISLFVAESNTGAQRIYERLGFRAHRRLVAFRWDHLLEN